MISQMKGPAANFNFLMTQRNHEQYIDRIWICNKQWPNPQQRIVRVDRKKKKKEKENKCWFLRFPIQTSPLYSEFYFQQFILEEPLRLGVGNRSNTLFAPSPWIADQLCSPSRRQTGVCVIVWTPGQKNIPDKGMALLDPTERVVYYMPTFLSFLYWILNLERGWEILKIINPSFILKFKKKKKQLFPSAVGIKLAAGKKSSTFISVFTLSALIIFKC